MTPEEAISQIEAAVISGSIDDVQCGALKMAINALKNQPNWISVKDRMPDLIPCNAGTAYSEAVVVLTEDNIVCTAIWNGEAWIGDFDYWEADEGKVTHWKTVLPLPKPRAEEEDDG